MTRLTLIMAGLLAVMACDMESYNATKALEDATKEIEDVLDQKRKDAICHRAKTSRATSR